MDRKKQNTKKTGKLSLIFKAFGAFVALILVLIIGLSIAIMVIVDKPFVEGQMAKALHRQVSIGDVSVSIFSVLSGIQVKNVAISNYKSAVEINKLTGKPVPEGDKFVSLKSFTFKVAFGPLLHGQISLKELVLDSPGVNIIKYKNGQFNFSDLTSSKPLTEKEKAELEKQRIEDEKKAKLAKPLSADDIPVQITVGKVGIENGIINFTDQSTAQKVSIYDLTAKVFDIDINPKNLDKADIVKITAGFGIKTIGATSKGSVKSFDIVLKADGSVIPFDKKTRILNPEISMKAGSSRGTLTGLQIFDKLKSNESLEKYCGKLDFLKDDIKWSNAFVSIWYKDNVLKLSDGSIKTDDFSSVFGGVINIASMGINATADMTLAEKHTAAIKGKVTKNIDKLIIGKARSIVKTDKVADAAMKPLTGSGKNIYLKYAITGLMTSPATKMVAPKLPSLKDLVKESSGDVADIAKDKAKEVAQKKAEETKSKAASKAKDEAKKKFKKPSF